MNAPERFFLPDIQASTDLRRLAIDKVGVRGLRYPLAHCSTRRARSSTRSPSSR
jgi:GTP cyclohydrolase FolE2